MSLTTTKLLELLAGSPDKHEAIVAILETQYLGELYRTTYVVEGDDNFPFDMLRHTCSWPALEAEIPLVGRPLDGYLMRRVTLAKHHRDPVPELEVERWKSFGWRVVRVIETVLL